MAIFSFDIEPLAQARPRIAPRPYPHIYDPNNVKKYKEELHSLAVQKMKESGLKLFDGALSIKISFYRPIQMKTLIFYNEDMDAIRKDIFNFLEQGDYREVVSVKRVSKTVVNVVYVPKMQEQL